MALLFNSNKIVEKDYREKQYFSSKPKGKMKIKCFSCLLVFMMILFFLNLYQALDQMSAMNTFL